MLGLNILSTGLDPDQLSNISLDAPKAEVQEEVLKILSGYDFGYHWLSIRDQACKISSLNTGGELFSSLEAFRERLFIREDEGNRRVKFASTAPILIFEGNTNLTINQRYLLLENKLKKYIHDKSDISHISQQISREVESIIIESGFLHNSLIWYCIHLNIPLRLSLISKVIDENMKSIGVRYKSEKDALAVTQRLFPSCQGGVLLGPIEMDIYIPSKGLNVEIDSVKSPKKSKGRKRDIFLFKNFGVDVVRYKYRDKLNKQDFYLFLRDLFE